ncbi:hypothetical protein GFS31_42810 (plasmid) [Leptolyngbya sp. BL0902]|nr:hypothetical protein GFS31_42810 [Leptolyngbya sp. BL0902]
MKAKFVSMKYDFMPQCLPLMLLNWIGSSPMIYFSSAQLVN